MFSSMDPLPIRFNFSIACYTEMGSLVPMPNLENWKFQIDTNDEIPQVRLYCALERVSQWSLSNRKGHFIAIRTSEDNVRASEAS